MSKNIILSVSEDELDIFKKQYLNLLDIQEEITKLEENIPDKRKKKEYSEWKEKINFFIDLYNAKSKYKAYAKIK